MPRILPLPKEQTPVETNAAYSEHTSTYHGRITNMKATLGHSKVAFQAYMEWYPLFEEVKKSWERLAGLFAWSISEASDCPLCSTYFRKVIIEAGEKPEALVLTEEEQQVLTFGAAIAQNKGFIAEEVYQALAKRLKDRDMVVLTAFAGIMIATNIFNNVNHTDIDEYLFPFLSTNP